MHVEYVYLSYDVASESVIKPCIKNDNPLVNFVITLCVDVHEKVAFSDGKIVTF